VKVAIENLAPVHPGPPRLCHDPLAVRDLVRRLASPAAGMLLDVGHLHPTTGCAGGADDNLGVRRRDIDAPGIDPLKLDLHLPPGRGSLPWGRVAAVLREHSAPLLLEVEPSQRPALAELTAALLRTLAAPSQRAAA
jgi:sugar phosphate isomerase/epimerase